MNRAVNDLTKSVRYLALGKGTNNPSRQDLRLGKQTVRKEVKYDIDIDNNMIVFSAVFTAAEILNTTEIGLLTENEILVARDVYSTITSDILENTTSTVTMYYNVHYEAGSIHSKWTTSNKSEDILYKFENNPVIGVRELNTNSGYLLVDSLDDLDTLESAGYFHDVISRNLYIKTSDADTISTVDEKQIVIMTR